MILDLCVTNWSRMTFVSILLLGFYYLVYFVVTLPNIIGRFCVQSRFPGLTIPSLTLNTQLFQLPGIRISFHYNHGVCKFIVGFTHKTNTFLRLRRSREIIGIQRVRLTYNFFNLVFRFLHPFSSN